MKNGDMMHFTVVIPLYNKEKAIKRAIDSVLNQTYKNFEIIVIDDGSTDFSVEKIRSINNSKIKVIQQKNAGVSAARNKGIYNANFDYIAFLDADDAWKPEFLETINKLINMYPKNGAYATSYEFVKSNGAVDPSNENNSFDLNWEGIVGSYFKESIKTPLISASSVVIPKEVFNKVGYFPLGITRGEDLDMWCRIALKYKIVFSNKSLARYYKDAENMATRKEIEYNKSFMSYAEEVLIKERNKGNTSIYFEEYMISRLISKARFLISINKRKEARELLYRYRTTKYNKKILFKTYILSFRPIYAAYNRRKGLK
ncbi:glycosyltransferase [Gracilibacillus salitolerans]|uniref:Glycosyltransferase n=1 Tax=Gracilibacillus salitolerans TaxID=2663022 RepID=A0A5Q2TQ54_9BACI|nr:glycosyltransferase family A protein [Gracilibacillus salitolerans]QGH36257.1 glycosyltransferase [Gracilibacillus salitolerans]